mmetsp:Transcript_16562/g.18418  ORF Transcript_16562/g.18418 Transcript_16562/m.18418 type:complete len:237 (+) Transcript_16562:10-720(+)
MTTPQKRTAEAIADSAKDGPEAKKAKTGGKNGTLYHKSHASSVRPLQVIYELGLSDIEIKTITDDDYIKTDEYTKLNPNQTVPLFVDEHVTLTESTAICLYLLDKYDTEFKIHPKHSDAVKRAKFYEWMFYGPATMYATTTPIYLEKREKEPSEEHMDKQKKKWVERCGTFLEKALQHGNDYILGDYSAADSVLGYDVYAAENLGILDADKFPKIAEYLKRLKGRDSFKKTFPEVQ